MSTSVTIGGVPLADQGSPRVIADSVITSADDANGIAGPSTATFTIVSHPRDALPSLAPFTPCQIEVDGARIWSGFIWAHVRSGRSVSVECRGTKEHLNGGLLSIAPVTADMSRWQDIGLLSGAGWPPSGYTPQNVAVGGEGIVLTYPVSRGASERSFASVQVVNAAIPFSATGIRVAVVFSGSVAGRFRVWSNNTLKLQLNVSYALDIADTVQGSVYTATLSAALYVFMAFGFTTSAITVAQTCTITMCWLYDQPSRSVHGSDVAARVAALVPQISTDRSRILATPTVLGHAAWPPPGASPAAILGEVGAYDDALIAVDANDRLVFAPRGSTPRLELGAACPAVSESPSDPTSLVSQVLISSKDSTGRAFSLAYTLLDLPELGSRPSPNVTVPNGGFAVDTSGWTSVSSLTRGATGGPVANGPYALWRSSSGGDLSSGDYVYNALNGTFRAGVPYQLTVWLADSVGPSAFKPLVSTLSVWLYDSADLKGAAITTVRIDGGTGWKQCVLTWTPQQNCSNASLLIYNIQTRLQTYPDGLSAGIARQPGIAAASISELAIPGPLISRQVRRSGQITVPIIAFEGLTTLLAQSYLRGSIRQSYTAVRDAVDGAARHPGSHAPLPAAALLASVGQPVRIADRVDPISGAVGASGYVSAVVYEHAARKAQVTVGERYGDYAALLSRVVNVFGA